MCLPSFILASETGLLPSRALSVLPNISDRGEGIQRILLTDFQKYPKIAEGNLLYFTVFNRRLLRWERFLGKGEFAVIAKTILKYFSRDTTEPPYEVAQHRHEYWELVYYGGLGISTVNGIAFNYLPGSYVVIPSNMPHAEKALSHGDLFCLGFEAELEFSADFQGGGRVRFCITGLFFRRVPAVYRYDAQRIPGTSPAFSE